MQPNPNSATAHNRCLKVLRPLSQIPRFGRWATLHSGSPSESESLRRARLDRSGSVVPLKVSTTHKEESIPPRAASASSITRPQKPAPARLLCRYKGARSARDLHPQPRLFTIIAKPDRAQRSAGPRLPHTTRHSPRPASSTCTTAPKTHSSLEEQPQPTAKRPDPEWCRELSRCRGSWS